MLARNGNEALGVFSITPIGIALVLVGIVYMQLARWCCRAAAASTARTTTCAWTATAPNWWW